jgi:hypothetical protein
VRFFKDTLVWFGQKNLFKANEMHVFSTINFFLKIAFISYTLQPKQAKNFKKITVGRVLSNTRIE